MVFSFLKKLTSAPQPVKKQPPAAPSAPARPEVSLWATNAIITGAEYSEEEVMGQMAPVTHMSYFSNNAIHTAKLIGVLVPFAGREAIQLVWGQVSTARGGRLVYVVTSSGATYEPLGMYFLYSDAQKAGCINTETYDGFYQACVWMVRVKLGVQLNL